MKKALLILALVVTTSSAQAIQSYESTQNGGSNKPVKVYDQHGSYQGKYVKQSNGTVKQYGKTGSYEGYYKQTSSDKVKYYKANSKK